MEFARFGTIDRFDAICTIWEKIDGTNAQIMVYDRDDAVDSIDIKVASRDRIITPEDDNYGFATWAYDNKQALIETLGLGRWYGEWFGPGVARPYGLTTPSLALFNWHKLHSTALPPNVVLAPMLYEGPFSFDKLTELEHELRSKGSMFNGYPFPEGLVVRFHRSKTCFKHVFSYEQAHIRLGVPDDQEDEIDFSLYLTESRLKSVLSKDSRLLEQYPINSSVIRELYMRDLVNEHISNIPTQVYTTIRRKAYYFIRQHMERYKEYGVY